MNGILIINKPQGYTSHDIVNIVRKEFNIKKVGHTGTLDPNATGVLPVLVGQATKISKYLVEHKKTYIAELKLGEKSNTGDLEGEIIEKKDVPSLTVKEIKNALYGFLGKQKQVPPMYSSIKINGKKAYEYARSGKTIKIEPRNIEIFEIDLLKYESNTIVFKVECSKGTYIRTLCEDIATKLGTVGLMKNLCRTKVNEFCIEDSCTVEDIKNKENIKLISIEETFKTNQSVNLNNRKKSLFLNGVKLTAELADGIYKIYNDNIFMGLGTVEKKLLKRDVIIIDN